MLIELFAYIFFSIQGIFFYLISSGEVYLHNSTLNVEMHSC